MAEKVEMESSPKADTGSSSSDAGDAFAGMPQATTTWIGALGLTACLAAAGFIGKLALQQFLGIELGNWSALDLSIFAGRWAVDTLTFVLGRWADHFFLFSLLFLILVAPMVISYSLPSTHRYAKKVSIAGVVIATLGLVWVLAWCEIPTLPMNGWLTESLSKQLILPEPGLLKSRQADMRAIMLVSKLDGKDGRGAACGRTDLPALLKRHLDSERPAKTMRVYLEDMYAASVVICVLALLTLYQKQRVIEPTFIDEAFRGVRLIASFLLLPLALTLIPYMYGKLLYSTAFPEATFSLKPKDAKTPASPESTALADELRHRVLIIDQTDKYISILPPAGSPPLVVEILNRDDIETVQRYGTKDVLNSILIQCDWLPNSGASSDSQGGSQ